MADTTQQVKPVEERKDEELFYELFRVFPRVFGKREPRDEYFVNVLSKGDVTINDILQSPVVQAVTTDAEIIKRAIHRFRGFTITGDVVKQCTYQRTDPQNTVVVKDLPLGLQQEQVIALFHNETTPGPKAISARADQYNTWYVNFVSEEDSKAAFALGKNLTYEGKALRVNLKRDLHARHGYDPRGMGRPEYSNVDMMQMPHLMNPFQMYYSPMMANNAYYQYPPAGMPYPPMGSPVVYPMEMPPMGYPGYYMPQAYYSPGAQQQPQQQQQQQPGNQPSGMGYQQGRRPGRGGFAQAGAGGRGYNGPRKERSPRPVENQAGAIGGAEASIGEKAAETEEKPMVTATTNESAAVAAEEVMTTVEEVAVAVESLEIKEEAKKEPEEGEKRAPRQRNEGDRYAKGSGDRERRTSERKPQNSGAGARNGKSRDRSLPSSGTRGDGSEARKPKTPAIKFTMDSDFPILVDQKQSGAPSPSLAFDYASAVKKAAPVTPPSPPEQRAVSPVVEKAAAPVVEVVVEPVVVVEVPKAVAAVEERVLASVPVEAETKIAAPTGTTKKSFLDALKANQ